MVEVIGIEPIILSPEPSVIPFHHTSIFKKIVILKSR